jgi:hypothetical protein
MAAKVYRSKRIVANVIKISNEAIRIKELVTSKDATEIERVTDEYCQTFGITKGELKRLRSAIARLEKYYGIIFDEMLSISFKENGIGRE